MNVYKKLMQVQTKLKAPKNQMNKFGGYKYRSCEDILEALKPLLHEVKASIIINDEVLVINERFYIKAIVRFIDVDTGDFVESTALAREEENKKGMDASQLTGATSSYARKYALNGLFAIDDTKDSDFTNTHNSENKSTKTSNNATNATVSTSKLLSDAQLKRLYAIASKAGYSSEKVKEIILKKYSKEPKNMSKQEYDTIVAGFESMINIGK